MGIFTKLLNIQTKLKAPKGQYNEFGKYDYRSCEDILGALKPLLAEEKATVILKDELVQVGERYYIKAVARLIDTETNEGFEVQAFAREEETKKGMDGSQITGASSSYARKYALNGLFAIDDNKDSDDTNDEIKEPLKDDLVKEFADLGGTLEVAAAYYKTDIESLTNEQIMALVEAKKKSLAKAKQNA